jgi:exopolyphosphatase/guanosine-5'-triphosphate,3'-diphosphate pyrophosphatase
LTAVAAIDVGTNATRLLIARDGRAVERRAVITRLGEELLATGQLSPRGLERTRSALVGYAQLLQAHEVDTTRAVATAAARTATNADELLIAVESTLGIAPDVLTGEEEARLTFRGAVGELATPDRGPYLVLDVGGGTTELALGTSEPETVVSIDLGSEHLTARELPSDPPRPEELSNAVSIVHDQLDDALRALPGADEAETVVGVGGTITTMAAVELGRSPQGPDGVPLHHLFLSREAAEDVFRTLAGEPLADRVHNPGLPVERAPIIVGGCCIVVGFLRRLRAPGLTVSVRDLLDGVVAGLA